MKPFVASAIIGNGRILATLGSNGELHRLFWPCIDRLQHVHLMLPAILSPALGDRGVRLNDEGNWVYSQEYLDDMGILKTVARAKRSKLEVVSEDFVLPDRDILVRAFRFTNLSDKPVPAVFLYYSCLHINESCLYNTTCFDQENDVQLHYRHDTWFAVAGSQETADYQCGCGPEEFLTGSFNGRSLAMGTSGSQAWNLGVIEPGESRTVTVFITAANSRQQVVENASFAREQGRNILLKETAAFWETYLGRLFLPHGIGHETARLLKRSVMACKMMMNRDTGGIIAAPEFDETYSRCGGYAYVWGRDAAIIAHAMLKAGYPEYAWDFYRWAAKNQFPGGEWPQRQFTDGELAPRWGDQVDSTGAIIWGICQFYKETWDNTFIEEMWPTVARAGEYLANWINDTSGLARMSWDLWEERFGEHAHSFAAVHAGLKGAGLVARALGETGLALEWLETAKNFREHIYNYFWDPCLGRFLRSAWTSVRWEVFECHKKEGGRIREVIGPKGYITYEYFGDCTPDAGLLGLTVPFGVFPPDDERMKKTVASLVEKLTNQATGGLKRYENDCYIGGNPWVLTTLWLGMFEGISGDWESAAGRLRWALDKRTPLDFLPEQVDRKTGETAWVVPLAWSHAMFILLVNMMAEANEIDRLP
ncbi:MAG: glycoside hydrolase family 15 [Firmicutes bacterium HGW-Firmicutes-14]|nr:MAG: glycoside hydrolase family 15 [Firmicutes bacterium HGW-Firmicutes-14]